MIGEFLEVVALVLSLQGNVVVCDRGVLDGVRVGDRGIAFYTLIVDGRQVRVDVGQVEVVQVEDSSSRLRAVEDVVVRAGHSVEFQIEGGRTGAAENLRLAEARTAAGELDSALRFYRRLNALVPGDALVSRRIQELESRIESADRLDQERGRLEYYRTAARRSLGDGDLETARSYVARILRVEETDEVALQLQRQIDDESRLSRMFFVQPGEYWVGRDSLEARFYNEQPRHKRILKAFWSDRSPVASEEFERRTGQRILVAGPVAVGVTFEQAATFCERFGKRLPTEFEWEVAAGAAGFEYATGVAEWTGSWYEAYPGNSRKENEYGKQFRVTRGLDTDSRFDLHARTFLDPTEKSFDVGFRCVQSP